MITDGKKWHYLGVKPLPALFRRITSIHNGDFYCLNCFHSYSTKNKLKTDACYVEMPNEDNKILKYNHGEKSLKAPFMIYADLECLLEKIHSCQNNPKRSYREKKKLSICLLTIHCLQIVRLMHQKISFIVTEAKIVWKSFVKT